jgi:hypothetical protein
LTIEKIDPRPDRRIHEQNLIPDKQRRFKIARVESFISIQVSQNARIHDPEKFNLRDSAILNQCRIGALPKETTSDQPATKEPEPRGSQGQLMEDRTPPEGPINCQKIAGGGVVRHGSVPSLGIGEDLRSWVGFLSRRDFTIVARQFIAWIAFEERRVPEGRLIRGRREIRHA